MEARKAVAYRPNSTSLKSMAISSGLVESPASKHPLVLKLRNDLCSRGIDGAGFAELYRRLNVLDKDGSKTLTFEELRVAIQRCDLDFSSKEVSKVFSSFDSHDKGYIDIEDFMQELRGPISKFRRNLIQKAFHKVISLSFTFL